MSSPLSDEQLAQYQALTVGSGLVVLPPRTQLELTGADRAAFLHNLCTNNIKALAPGSGCEAFITNVQGKVLGHVYLFAGTESLILDTVPDQGPAILEHLERYHIREKVAFHDRTAEWHDLLLAGAQASAKLAALAGVALPETLFAHGALQLSEERVWFRNADLAGPTSFLLSVREELLSTVRSRLCDAGFTLCSEEAAEMVRLEAGSPFYGRDISSDNLPQEVHRTERAISFIKGCYLGQETVARIDAVGHVNRLLVGLQFVSPELPGPGAELRKESKVVGKVTSVAFSPRLQAPLALAYVRREHSEPGTRLLSDFGPADVVSLPL